MPPSHTHQERKQSLKFIKLILMHTLLMCLLPCMEDTHAGICAGAYIYTLHNARMHAHIHRRTGAKLRLEAPKHRLTVTLLPAPVGGAQGTSPACPLLLLIQRVPPDFKPGLHSDSYSHYGGKAQPSKNSSLIYTFLNHFSSKAKILGLELPAP